MNRRFVIFWILMWFALPAHADLTPREIVEKATHLDWGKSASAETRIVVTDAAGKTRDRTMRLKKKTIDGREHTRVEFTAPADIKGLALLMVVQKDGEPEQHL